MTRFCWFAMSFIAMTVLFAATTSSLPAAEQATLSQADQPPPKELADPIRSTLSDSVVRLGAQDKPFFEFWFPKQVSLAEKPAEGSFEPTVLKEGTLMGALRVNRERRDFKDEEIPPGVYVLRFGLQPEDGNHQGTSPSRTFFLLVPADKDRELNAHTGHDALVKASSKINAASHPANLNLQPVEPSGDTFPRLATHHGGKHKVVYLRLPAKVEGQSEPTTLSFALVYEGKGEI